MAEGEHVFKDLYVQGRGYFKASMARIVLFFAICAVIVFVFLAAVTQSNVVSFLMVIAGITAMCATSFDSWESRRKYKKDIDDAENDFALRLAAKTPEEAKGEAAVAFGEEERTEIKKKLRNYNIALDIKLLFLAVLVVLLFTML